MADRVAAAMAFVAAAAFAATWWPVVISGEGILMSSTELAVTRQVVFASLTGATAAGLLQAPHWGKMVGVGSSLLLCLIFLLAVNPGEVPGMLALLNYGWPIAFLGSCAWLASAMWGRPFGWVGLGIAGICALLTLVGMGGFGIPYAGDAVAGLWALALALVGALEWGAASPRAGSS